MHHDHNDFADLFPRHPTMAAPEAFCLFTNAREWLPGEGNVSFDLDINVGRVLDRLDELGIRNSTYIVYTSDNGAPQSQR